MAIKVNGTTVIDDSRNLSNVGGLKTINSTSILGSGNISAGASTSYNAVGTYVFGMLTNSGLSENSTHSGSNIKPAGIQGDGSAPLGSDAYQFSAYPTSGSGTLSGTWRSMGRVNVFTNNQNRYTLFVRIS